MPVSVSALTSLTYQEKKRLSPCFFLLVVVTRRFSISNSSFLFIPYVGDGLRVRGRRTRSTSTTYFVFARSFGHLVICQNRKLTVKIRHYNINIYIYI